MGVAGPDLQLSSRAKEVFPFGVECKSQERINVWDSWAQTQRHCVNTELTPLLICRRNRTAPFAVLPWAYVLPLLARASDDPTEGDPVAQGDPAQGDSVDHAPRADRLRRARAALVEALRALDDIPEYM